MVISKLFFCHTEVVEVQVSRLRCHTFLVFNEFQFYHDEIENADHGSVYYFTQFERRKKMLLPLLPVCFSLFFAVIFFNFIFVLILIWLLLVWYFFIKQFPLHLTSTCYQFKQVASFFSSFFRYFQHLHTELFEFVFFFSFIRLILIIFRFEIVTRFWFSQHY